MKTIFTSIFLFFMLVCQAQVTLFKTESTTFRYSKDSITWDNWHPIIELSVNIVFDLGKETIVVYNVPEKKYVVVVLLNEQTLEDRNAITFGCVDDLGVKCVIQFVHMRNGSSYMSVMWEDIQVVYKITKL